MTSILVTTSSSGRSARAGLYCGELVADRPVVLDRVGAVERHGLDEVDEQGSPLDVTKELVAQPMAGVRTFDQPGDVGHDEVLIDRRRRSRGWGISS